MQNFVEVGPGKVLCGLMRQIDRSRNCVNVEDEASLQKTMNHFTPASSESGLESNQVDGPCPPSFGGVGLFVEAGERGKPHPATNPGRMGQPSVSVNYFSDAISITKRYFTSLRSMRS